MALPVVFANVTELDTPDLDSDFNALGNSVVIRCTATGTNTIVLTPAASQPTIASYTSGMIFTFAAAASTTGATTINVSGVGAKNVYKNAGATLIGANDLAVGGVYAVLYNSALNSSAGGFVLLNAAPTTGAAGAVQGRFQNLTVQPTNNTNCTITAGSLAVSDGSTSFTTLLNVSVSVNSSTSGAGGLDTGGLSASTFYFVYVLYNPSTLTAVGIMSLSATAPTLPSGYTQYARVGAIRTDSSSRFLRTLQKNYRTQYVVNSVTPTTLPQMLTNVSGASTIAVSAFVPSTASEIYVVAQLLASASANAVLAANTFSNSTSGGIAPIQWTCTNSATQFTNGSLVLESTNIFANGSTGVSVWCTGWVDNL